MLKKFIFITSYWVKRSIELLSVDIEANKDHYYSLALGLPGVGLTLMSYLSQKSASWSDLMLL